MISALAWIPRGAAKAVPEVAEVTEAEIAAMKAAAAEDVEDGAEVWVCRRRLPPFAASLLPARHMHLALLSSHASFCMCCRRAPTPQMKI
jgi:hypothetical protein